MSVLTYDWPSDKVVGVWAKMGGTVNSNYPLTNIDDGKPWNPVIFTGNPTRIYHDAGSPVPCPLVSFIHCNFPAGYEPTVGRGNVLGASSAGANVVCDGPAEDGMPANPFVELTGSYRYTWIDFPSTATLLSLGLIRLSGAKRTFSDASTTVRDRSYGAIDREHHPSIERTTDAGVQLGYSRGTRARWVSGTIRYDATGYLELRGLLRASRGRALPFLVIPDPDVNEALWVKWGTSADTALERNYTDLDVNDVKVDFEEVGRGLAP